LFRLQILRAHFLTFQEWLPSLPLHLDLYACLSIPPPQFAHLPILLNPDGTKMSKRKGNVQVVDYMVYLVCLPNMPALTYTSASQHRGWEPEAVLNWLALAGWGVHQDRSSTQSTSATATRTLQHAPDSTAMMSLSELVMKVCLFALLLSHFTYPW
jgi:glutamyl-tRNA synthetase